MKIKLCPDLLKHLGSIPGPYKRGKKSSGIREQVINSYEADATDIKIIFTDFRRGYKMQPNSSIIIQDNGEGVSLEMLQNWFQYKITGKIVSTEKGRMTLGGGGKGRVGTYLLGSRGRITSSPKGDTKTYILEYDFTKSQATLTEKNNSAKTHGTKLEIFDLHGTWSHIKIIGLCDKFVRLYRRISLAENADCKVSLYKDDVQKFSITYRLRPRKQIWAIILYRLFVLNLKRIVAILNL